MPAQIITIPIVTLTATESITVVQPPPSLTRDELMSALAGLISTLQVPPVDQRGTVEVVYNLLQLGIPEIRGITGGFTSLNAITVAPTKSEFLIWAGLEEEGTNHANPALPSLPGPVIPEAQAVTKEGAIFIALASLLFCIGRQATENAKASVLDNRPDALIRRFGLGEEDQVLLPGRSAGPSREALELIYNAFANYTEVRAAITVFFIALRKQGAHLPIPLEIMMTNFNLMRGSGMTHVEAIIKLIRMHPWVLRVPKLEPFFYKFAEELEKFEKLDVDIRPYHRLLVPQAEYLFLSSELRPVIAVAGAFIEDVEKTFGGYVYNRTVYQDLIDEVKAMAPGYTPSSGLTKLATLLQVADEPLPPKAAPLPTPPSQTV